MTANKKNLTRAIAIIGSALLIISFFLPYAASTKEQAEWLSSISDETDEMLKMTYGQLINISMLEYASVYSRIGDPEMIIYTVLVGIIALFAIMTLLFSFLGKPIPIIIFDVLSAVAFSIQTWDYNDRGVISNGSYNWGIAVYLFYIAIAIVLAGAIWMLIEKSKSKKAARMETEPEA